MEITLKGEECRQYLISKVNKMAKELYGSYLNDMPLEVLKKVVDEDRASGKTTARALDTIARAMNNPRQNIEVFSDHSHGRIAQQAMLKVIDHLIMKLEFKCFTLNFTKCTITYDI